MTPPRLTLRQLFRLSMRALRGREPRHVAALHLLRPRGLFQPEGFTGDDRYPRVFALVRECVGDGASRNLLSFGCSSGEEVFSLRRYFSEATIKGLDISPGRIAACRRRHARGGADRRLVFAVAASAQSEDSGHYDAIFAMAVFRDGRLGMSPPRCDHLLHFADFERAACDLARCLKPGGILALRHANFHFRDTIAASGFETLLTLPRSDTPVYGRDNHLLPPESVEDVVFRKRED